MRFATARRELDPGASRHGDGDRAWRRPQPADASVPAQRLLDLQRLAGNAAVTDLLRRERRFSVVVEQVPKSFARTLGWADPDMKQWQLPVVALVPADGGVRFLPTSASHPEGTATVCPVGEYSAGLYAPVGDRLVGSGYPFEGIKWAGAPAPIGQSYDVRYIVDAAFQPTLVEAELEHLADFNRAFTLSAQRLATTVNGLTGQKFESAQAAVRALVATVDAPELVPENPNDLSSWTARVAVVASELTSMSMGRDESDHIPVTEFEHAGDVIRVKLRMKDVHRSPADLVKLENVKRVQASEQQPSVLVPQGAAHLNSGGGVELFKSAELSGDSLLERLPDKTPLRVVGSRGPQIVAALAALQFSSDVAAWHDSGEDLCFAVDATMVTSGAPPAEEAAAPEETPPNVEPAKETTSAPTADSDPGDGGADDFDEALLLAQANWKTGVTVREIPSDLALLGPPPGAPPPPPPYS